MKTQGSVEYPGPVPGEAKALVQDGEIILGNNVLECKWIIADGHLRPIFITQERSFALPVKESECFQLLLADGQSLKASGLKIIREPQIDNLRPNPDAQRLGDRNAGKQVHVVLATPDNNLSVDWRVELRDGSNYVRQYVSLVARTTPLDVREIVLVELKTQHAKAAGTLDGSPVTFIDTYFLAFEHPLSKTKMLDSETYCTLPRNTPLQPREEQTYSSVVGVAPRDQLRRAFLYYVERERARPYQPFLHYNSWYDLGYGLGKILEPDALKVIDLFGRELIERRGVVMDSFVPDDGWDDPTTLWRFHEGFPNGFAVLQQRARQYKAGIGAWLSPWGGYGKAKEERMKYGRQEGFETNKNGFSMAGPKYYARFRDACLGMVSRLRFELLQIRRHQLRRSTDRARRGFEPDVEALPAELIGDLRKAKPSLFINVTTGTWSSPYWLWYADSTWRSGNDWGTCGWGSKRQQQVTYRDAQTWQNVVRRAAPYPINSLMTQGVMFANHGLPDDTDRIVEDIRAFFAGGTNCQELYLTPSLLDAGTWDALAEAAIWSRKNADVLVDTHWVGGDPAKGEVYGWASWSKRKGILALRNPKDEPGRISIEIGKAFELPQGAVRHTHSRARGRRTPQGK